MPCSAVTDIVVRESGRYTNDEIYSRAFPRSPWIGLIRRDVFPEGMGEIISNLTYERSAPTDIPTWTDITVEDGALGGACLPTATKIAIASTTRTWNLQRRALEGPDFCVEELRTPFAIRKQLDAIMDVLTDYALIEWEFRYRHEYLRLVKRKVVITMGGTVEGTGTGFPAACPNAQLTQGILDKYRLKLLRDGAAGSAMGMRNGAPILTAILSAEQSDQIITVNDEIREDLHWGKPSELLAPYGVERSYKGFYHLIDEFPMRGNCAGAVFTEVAPFDTVAATKGNKAEVRAAWESATAEVNFIFDRTVFTSRVPRTITNPADGFKFNPVNYMGKWNALNILDRDCNPDGTIIYHRGILASGSEPVHPERGTAFLSSRCDPAANLIGSCS